MRTTIQGRIDGRGNRSSILTGLLRNVALSLIKKSSQAVYLLWTRLVAWRAGKAGCEKESPQMVDLGAEQAESQPNSQARALQHPLTHDELLWLLGSLCNRYRIPFDAVLLAQEFPPPYTLATLHEAARSLGFKTGGRDLNGLDWQSLPMPAIAFIRAVPQHRVVC